MKRYLEQLIDDIQEAIYNTPHTSINKLDHNTEYDQLIVELVTTQYKTIEELTGICKSAFPEVYMLDGNQINMLNMMIANLLDSLNIDLTDKPKDIPKELLYDIFVVHWDDYVQYLPSSGFDWDLCTDDQMTCPYGSYCENHTTPDLVSIN